MCRTGGINVFSPLHVLFRVSFLRSHSARPEPKERQTVGQTSSRLGRNRVLLLVGWLPLVLQAANAQSTAIQSEFSVLAEKPAGSLPEFEVATIKPISPGGMHMVGVHVYPGGRVTIQTFALKSLICTAFDLSYWHISGGEAMDKQRYDLEAKPPEAVSSGGFNPRHSNSGIEDERLRQMLQALLIDRFHLKFHQETKTGTVLLLERSGKAVTLQSTNAVAGADSPYPSGDMGAVEGRGWSLHATSMPELAKFLSNNIVHQPVVDRTGLEGSFDFRSKNIVTKEDFQSSNVTSMFLPAVKEMGLKLESTNGPVVTFVIDHAEPQSPN